MKLENWKRHFTSYSRKNKRAHQKHINELAKYHLIGNRRWKRLGKILNNGDMNDESNANNSNQE